MFILYKHEQFYLRYLESPLFGKKKDLYKSLNKSLAYNSSSS